MTAASSNDPLRHDLHGIAVYNPDLLSEQELKAIFIARRDLLERLADGLRAERPAHSLIVGVRGMGKTTLLRRLKYEIHDDAELAARWLPLVFPEEQYNVTRLSDFYLNCLDALSDTLESLGDSKHTQEVDRFIGELEGESESTIAKAAREGLQEMSKRLERGFVLLVDNVERILDDLTEDEGWAFRDLLSSEHGIVLIGASTQAVESTYQYKQPFFDFFKVWELSGFTAEETECVLRTLAQATQNPQVVRWIEGDRARLKTLNNLSGGNPRTVVLLFQLLVQGIEGDVRTDLERLLDMCTPLYKARFEELPAQGQQVLDALALLWEPATAAQVAEKARLDVTTISSQLHRLVRQGVVEKVALPPGKRTGFQIAERFFNIWYLMRASRRVRRRLLWLAQFLKMFYSEPERRQRASEYLRNASMESSSAMRHAEYGFALAQSLSEKAHSAAVEYRALALLNSTNEMRCRIHEILDLEGEDRELKPVAERLRLMSEAKDSILNCPADVWPEELDRTEFWHLFGGSPSFSVARKQRIAAMLVNQGREKIRAIFETMRDEKREWAKTTFPKADSCRMLDEFYAAMASGYFDGPTDSASATIAAQTLEFTALPTIVAFCAAESGSNQSEDVYRQFLQLVPKSPRAWSGLGNLLSEQLERYDDAEDAYRKAIEIDPHYAAPWNNLGNLLCAKLARYEDAELAYRKAIQINPKLAAPWNGLGHLLSEKLARYEEAEQAYCKAIQIDSKYAAPWNGLGNLLSEQLGRYEDAESAYHKAIDIDPYYAAPWNNLGNLLCTKLARYEEAEQAYRKAIQIDSKNAAPWDGLGNLLSEKLVRYEDAEHAYRKAIQIDPKSVAPWNNLGNLLKDKLARYEEAEHAYRKAIEIDSESAVLWNNLGLLLHHNLSGYEDAEHAYRKAIEIDPKSAAPWSGLGNLLSDKLARYEEAEHAFRKAIEINPEFEDGLNAFAWFLYEHRPETRQEAEGLARQAFELRLDSPHAAHTYATILVRNGRWFAAIEPARKFLESEDTAFFEQCWPDIVTFFREAALTGHAEESAKLLHECGKSEQWRPLVEALMAVAEGSTDRLLRLAPEMRTPATELFNDIRTARVSKQ